MQIWTNLSVCCKCQSNLHLDHLLWEVWNVPRLDATVDVIFKTWSRPSTARKRKTWLDPGFSGPISYCLPFAPVHFITVSAVRFARVSRWDENLPITPVKPMSSPRCNTTVASLAAEMVLDVFRRVWLADCGQISEDPPGCVCFTSTFTLFALRTLWITNKWAKGEWICMTWDEWVGELCVGMCVLILSCLRHDSLAGGVWTQGAGWFKCLKTTSGPPVLVNHNCAAAWTRPLNKEKTSTKGATIAKHLLTTVTSVRLFDLLIKIKYLIKTVKETKTRSSSNFQEFILLTF